MHIATKNDVNDMGRPSQCIAKCKKLDSLENNLYYDHIFVQQFSCVTRMGEKERMDGGLGRNNSNFYLWMVGFKFS